jgi:hypothetical protein
MLDSPDHRKNHWLFSQTFRGLFAMLNLTFLRKVVRKRLQFIASQG